MQMRFRLPGRSASPQTWPAPLPPSGAGYTMFKAMSTYQAVTQPLQRTSSSSPLGATVADGGVNFSVYSRDACRMELLLFDREDDSRPSRTIQIDPLIGRTYHYWHTFVTGLRGGQLYGYRVHG